MAGVKAIWQQNLCVHSLQPELSQEGEMISWFVFLYSSDTHSHEAAVSQQPQLGLKKSLKAQIAFSCKKCKLQLHYTIKIYKGSSSLLAFLVTNLESALWNS